MATRTPIASIGRSWTTPGFPWTTLRALETFGSPFVGWVQVSANPGAPQPFTFQAHLEALVP
jgi:hypothetical protein